MDDIDIQSLLSCVLTLKKQAKSRLPLLKMRSKMIPLKTEKQTKQKDKELLIMFDPVHLFTKSKSALICSGNVEAYLPPNTFSVIESDIRGAMHIGLGEFHDAYLQDKLYKSHAWRSSIRTTSGEFAYYRTGLLILLSDCVSFDCRVLHCRKGCRPGVAFAYIGRVIGVGRDFRSSTVVRRG